MANSVSVYKLSFPLELKKQNLYKLIISSPFVIPLCVDMYTNYIIQLQKIRVPICKTVLKYQGGLLFLFVLLTKDLYSCINFLCTPF